MCPSDKQPKEKTAKRVKESKEKVKPTRKPKTPTKAKKDTQPKSSPLLQIPEPYIEPEPLPEPKTLVEILTESYQRLVSSKMTPRAIKKWLERNVEKKDLPVLCSIGMINVDMRKDPFERVALEVWQNARVYRGMDRYRFNK
jgi:hypothetical protein